VKVITFLSQKWRKTDTLSQQTANRKCHMDYRFMPFLMTLNDLKGHLPVARFSDVIRRVFVQHLTRFQLTSRVVRSLRDR